LYGDEKLKKQYFRKESSENGVWITPTTVESRDALEVKDYG
jgi:hypothetical protein